MDQVSKRRGRPLPAAKSKIKPIVFDLEEALAVENVYRHNLFVIQHNMPGEVTLKSRDAVVHLLRFLKIWFDVPEKVFFVAVARLDLFIARMKVQEKYLKCVAFACFYIALCGECINITIAELVSVSWTNFGMPDVLRMANIITDKLKMPNSNDKITTCADILKIYLKFLNSMSSTLRATLNEKQLVTKLELLVADHNCASFRPSTLAFTLLRLEIDKQMTQTITKTTSQLGGIIHTFAVMKDLQLKCKVKSADLGSCSHHASKILKQYNNEERCTNNTYLKWKSLPMIQKLDHNQTSLDVIKEKPNEPFQEKSFREKGRSNNQ